MRGRFRVFGAISLPVGGVNVVDLLLNHVNEVHGAVHRNGVRKRGSETGHLVETEESDHATDDHRMRHDVVRKAVDKVGLDFAELHAKVRLIDAQSDRGRGTQTVPTDDHRQRDEVEFKILEIRRPQVREG